MRRKKASLIYRRTKNLRAGARRQIRDLDEFNELFRRLWWERHGWGATRPRRQKNPAMGPGFALRGIKPNGDAWLSILR